RLYARPSDLAFWREAEGAGRDHPQHRGGHVDAQGPQAADRLQPVRGQQSRQAGGGDAVGRGRRRLTMSGAALAGAAAAVAAIEHSMDAETLHATVRAYAAPFGYGRFVIYTAPPPG